MLLASYYYYLFLSLLGLSNSIRPIELTRSSFDEFIHRHDKTVILYYVPWCHWCQKFLPVYDQVADIANSLFKGINDNSNTTNNNTDTLLAFGKINVNEKENRILMEKEHVLSFPTIKLHSTKGAVSEEYDGENNAKAVLKWLVERSISDMTLKTHHQTDFIINNLSKSETIAIFSSPNNHLEHIYNTAKSEFEYIIFTTVFDIQLIIKILDYLQLQLTTDKQSIDMINYLRNDNPKQPFIILLNPSNHNNKDDDTIGIKSFQVDNNQNGYKNPSIFIFPEFPNEIHTVSDHNLVLNFLKSRQFPLISRWSATFAPRLLGAGKPFLVAFTSKVDENETNYKFLKRLEDILLQLTKSHRWEFITFVSGVEKFFERRLLSTLGVDTVPALVYVTVNSAKSSSGIHTPMLKYVALDEVNKTIFDDQQIESKHRTTDGINAASKWIEDILNQRIRPNIKSEEPIPLDENSGPVTFLTALTFQQEVLKNDTDYLVDFYAPWCGHCRVLFPLFESAARAFKQVGIENIKFGKIDATANEVPGVYLRGYPTLMLYRAGNKNEPLIHHGGVSSPEDIIHFMYEGVSQKFDLRKVEAALKNPSFADELPKRAGEL